MLSADEQLLTDKDLREASPDQINDLIARINLMLQMNGEPGLVKRGAEESGDEQTS